MQHKLPPLPARIAIAVVLLGTLLYFGIRSFSASRNGEVTASGSIETIIVHLAPEMSGKVSEVFVDEGQPVEQNDTLLKLDPNLLQRQRDVAAANLQFVTSASQTAKNALDTAKAQYQIALQASLSQDKKSRLGDWNSPDQSQFNQPNWYFTRAEQAQAAQLQVDDASKRLDQAKQKLADITQSVDKAAFIAAEQRLLNARLAYLISKDVNTRAQNATTSTKLQTPGNMRNCAKDKGYHYADPIIMNLQQGCTADENLTASSQDLYDAAKEELTNAQQAYDKLLTTQAANEVLQARADVSVAQENYYAALDHLRALETGDQSPSVTAAEGVLSQAQAAYDQSQKAVMQAQANLDLLDEQLSKLTIYAPRSGIILTRNVEPGEFVQPGAVALTMADLEQTTITVYVPEDVYGKISLGQKAEVHADSFPDLSFNGTVIQIADQAEFTPRNVQTVEGRSATFYAIKLKVENPDGKLKIGMPADVIFK